MAYRELIDKHYKDLTNQSSLLASMVNSYRLLIGGASELFNISLAKKSDVKEAIERAEKLGDIIDDLIKSIDDCNGCYIRYCEIMNKYVQAQTHKDVILTEIDYELDFNNSQQREDEDEE
ncbi:hypothetical protein [Clostridium sp.]|uniref:hypothetical protein n=1 Tax=Clostridium sp. TaxID=1506 RepID=UPI003F3A736A